MLPWHEDVIAGYRWNPHRFYRRYEVPLDRADIKIPWELSRGEHLPILATAYRISNEGGYVDEVVQQIDDWIHSNPVGYGINWASAMEVAIRAVNWLWAYRMVADAPQIDERFATRLLASLLAHGRHIAANIEQHAGGITTNHTVADHVGLVYLGLQLDVLPEARTWLETGVAGIVDCMASQVAADGVHYENSISYHRLVTEMFLGTYVLAEQNGRPVPEQYRESLQQMLEFTYSYTRPDGLAPLIGDSDDGRLQILSQYFDWCPQDHRYLLGAGAVLFQRDDFAALARSAPGSIEYTAWMLGAEAARQLAEREPLPSRPESRSFPTSGRFVMRRERHYAFVCADEVGTAGLGSHKHNDILSYELAVDGVPVIVDPGTGVYTRDVSQRDQFRSTRAHNTVMVDGIEQNEFVELFSLRPDAGVCVTSWRSEQRFDLLEFQHTGYQRLPDPVTHRRLLLMTEPPFVWLVVDTLTGRDEHVFDSFVHLAPDGEFEAPDEDQASLREAIGGALASAGIASVGLEPHLAGTLGYARAGVAVALVPINVDSFDVTEGGYSPRYGQRVAAPVLRLSVRARGNSVFGYACVACAVAD